MVFVEPERPATSNFNLLTPRITDDQGDNYSTIQSWNKASKLEENSVESGGIAGVFVDPDAPDFRLASGSPAIDMGTNQGNPPADDFLGESRPANVLYDIGAYEYVPRDAGVVQPDASAPGPDAAEPGPDAAQPGADAALPGLDAASGLDASVAIPDTGTPDVGQAPDTDAALPDTGHLADGGERDSGAVVLADANGPVDASWRDASQLDAAAPSDGSQELYDLGGCGCSAPGQPLALLLLGGLVVLAPRRRARSAPTSRRTP